MSRQDNGVNIFNCLGLTVRQAEVYIAIAQLGQPTAKSIAQTLKIARAEVYRATAELQKLGLIKKLITVPTTFRATSLSEGLSILLQQNAEKHEENCRQAKHFLQNFKNHNIEKPSQEDYQYCLTVGAKAEERELLRDIAETQTSMSYVLEWRGVLIVVNTSFEYLKEALERGVKIRTITNIPEDEKMPQIIQTLTETGFFEVKCFSAVPKADMGIYDKKLVALVTLPNSDPKEVQVLRSNNPAIVDLAIDYFELKWQSATTPCWHKKNIK